MRHEYKLSLFLKAPLGIDLKCLKLGLEYSVSPDLSILPTDILQSELSQIAMLSCFEGNAVSKTA